MSGSNAAISPVQDVLNQLDWLMAELEAQRPFLTRFPEVQLTAQPLADKPSLLGLYQQMVTKERAHLSCLGHAPAEIPMEGMDALLSTLISLRKELLAALASKSDSAWQEQAPGDAEGTLLDWAFHITLQDGEALRTVAERLHESQLSFGGHRPDGP